MFSCFVFFQIINLPVEFNASNRAKAQLVELGIVSPDQLVYVKKVLDAAAWTYVAGTLQAIMILLYYITRFRRQPRLKPAGETPIFALWEKIVNPLKSRWVPCPPGAQRRLGMFFWSITVLGMSTQAWTWHPNEIDLTFSTGC